MCVTFIILTLHYAFLCCCIPVCLSYYLLMHSCLFICLFILYCLFSRQLFIIYSELKEPSFRKVSIVIDYAIYSVAIIYFLVSISPQRVCHS